MTGPVCAYLTIVHVENPSLPFAAEATTTSEPYDCGWKRLWVLKFVRFFGNCQPANSRTFHESSYTGVYEVDVRDLHGGSTNVWQTYRLT